MTAPGPGLAGLLRAWLCSAAALPLWAVFAVVVAGNFAGVRFAVALNEWNGRFFNALQKVDAAAIYDALFDFVWLAAALIVVLVMTQYVKSRLMLSLRRDLTFRLIDVWLSPGSAHFQLRESGREPDNPDQRVIEDSHSLVSLAVNLSLSFLESALTIVSFSVILWQLSGSITVFGCEIPGYMFWVCLAYTVVATLVTHWIGHPLKRLNYVSQAREADLRYAFIEKRRHADAIAGAGGEAFESRGLKTRVRELLKVLIALVKKQRDLDFFTVGLGQVTQLAPIFFALPALLSGHIQLGGLMQIRGAFVDVARSFSWFIFVYDDLARLAAAWQRLAHLVEGLEEAERERAANLARLTAEGPEPAGGSDVVTADLSLSLPNAVAPRPVSLASGAGEVTLITGPSGVGKSTLLKTLAGFYGDYEGNARRRPGSCLWLPQRPYIFKGTLRDNLLYPGRIDADDATLRPLLAGLGLDSLVGRLDESADWANVLSGGEQQRIALARAALAKPDLLLLDEATSALDAPAARSALDLLRRVSPATTILLVTHQECFLSEPYRKIRLI